MKTYLIRIPQNNTKNAPAFRDLLIQLWETLRGDSIAFEIIATGQNIAFCFSGSDAATKIVSGLIYSITADADIVSIPDFTRKMGSRFKFISSELSLARKDIFPLQDYKSFTGDSLSGLLSVLAQCEPGERLIFQVVVRPEPDTGFHHFRLGWRKRFDKIRHMFRVKYWFKTGLSKVLKENIEKKLSQRLWQANIRVGALSTDPKFTPELRLRTLLGAVKNFNTMDFNQIKVGKVRRLVDLKNFQTRSLNSGFLLSTDELATFFHLPNEREVPNIIHVLSRKDAPPPELPINQEDSDISFFGHTNFRNQRIPFGIKRSDRRRHLYCVGKSGSGKSKMLELLIKNDLLSGRGIGVLDPHGDLVDNILKLVPKNRVQDVVLFDPSDLQFPPSFNPLEQVPEELKIRVTIGFIEIFKKLFGTNWSPRLEHVLRYTTLALLDSPGTTVLSILKMLTDKNYRQLIVRNIQDNVVKNFWVNEFASWSEKFDNEAITPLLNKVGQFVATNMIRNIVGQPQNRIDFRHIMDNQKILLMKVSKGILGEENAALLGAIAVTKVYQAAMARADQAEEKRVDFYFYVDEFHNFATDTFDEILSEARKYRLNLTLANQFLGQLDPKILKTVFGNVGSILTFRVGGEDSEILAKEFNPRFSSRDIINLGIRDFVVKMSVNGEIREAFSGRTLKMEFPKKNFVKECVDFSREHYSRPLQEVESILARWEEGEFNPNTDSAPPSSSPFDEEVEFEEPLI